MLLNIAYEFFKRWWENHNKSHPGSIYGGGLNFPRTLY